MKSSEKLQLLADGQAAREALIERAGTLRDDFFGNRIFVRAVVEVSNYCRENCSYCGMRRDNKSLERFRIEADRVLEIIVNHRPDFVTDINIQAGEDPIAVREIVIPLVRDIRRYTPLGVSVCLGTLSSRDYAALQDAGASYYIIKLETGDETHYRQISAPGSLAERVQAIRQLASSGWNVSSGLIIGLPGQRNRDIVRTLDLLEELPLSGCSVSPFIPGQQTPFSGHTYGDLDLAIACVAMMRVSRPHWVIPAVSAMTFQREEGYLRAIRAGANLATINLTPPGFRDNYLIYKQNRLIMNQDRVLRAIEEAGCEPSRLSLCDHRNGLCSGQQAPLVGSITHNTAWTPQDPSS